MYSRSGFGTFRHRHGPIRSHAIARPRRQAGAAAAAGAAVLAAPDAVCSLLVNGLFGERGLADTIRARRAYRTASRDLDRLKQDNAALREQARRLRDDPGTIESVAREELGLVRPGEIVVTIKDVK